MDNEYYNYFKDAWTQRYIINDPLNYKLLSVCLLPHSELSLILEKETIYYIHMYYYGQTHY